MNSRSYLLDMLTDDGIRTPNATVQITKCNAGRDGTASLYFAGERLAFYSRRPGENSY